MNELFDIPYGVLSGQLRMDAEATIRYDSARGLVPA